MSAKLSFPFSEENIRALKAGDEVLISSTVFTGRGIRNLTMESVYIETSVVSYLVARPPARTVAHQWHVWTKDWWQLRHPRRR